MNSNTKKFTMGDKIDPQCKWKEWQKNLNSERCCAELKEIYEIFIHVAAWDKS